MIAKNSDLLWYSTLGFSMFPFIRSSDCVLIKKVPVETIRPKDVILFESEGENKICHSVAEVREEGSILWFYTKGYKESVDKAQPISQDRVLGKVVAIKRGNSIIHLYGRGMGLLCFRCDCFIAGCVLKARSALARIGWLKRIYKFIFFNEKI